MILADILYSYLANGCWFVIATLLSSPAARSSSSGRQSEPGAQLATLLSPLLSKDAEVFLPGTPGFENGTRTLAAKKPQIDLLVRVATAEDVQKTVCLIQSGTTLLPSKNKTYRVFLPCW